MSVPDWMEGGHLFLAAPTGYETAMGGKSTLAAYLAAEFGPQYDLTLIVNVKHDSFASTLDGYKEASDIEGVAQLMGEGHRRIVLTPTDFDWEAVSRRVMAFIRRLPDDMTKLVALDEAHELDDDVVKFFLRVAGNGHSTKTIFMSQDPTEMLGTAVKNSILVWVGPTKSSYEAWFRTHDRKPAFDHIVRNHDPYHWSVITGPDEGDWHHFSPVPEEYVV